MSETEKTIIHVKPQAQWIHDFNDQYIPQFNPELFKKEDSAMIDAISKVIYSCEKEKFFTIKVLSIETITDYEEIYNLLRIHAEQRKKKNSKDPNQYDYIQIRDSDIMLLKVTYFLQKNGVERMKINNQDVDVENPHQNLEVLIELPRYVNKYYYRLQGNLYVPFNQIVDGSTYNNSTNSSSKHDNVTLKTLFMSVRIYRMYKELLDVNSKETIKSIVYTLFFSAHVNVMFYFFAKYGYYGTMEWFHINFISITEEPITDPKYYSFKKHNLYINCPIEMFDEAIVQSLVSTLYDGIMRDTKLSDIYRWDYWFLIIGHAYGQMTLDKGISVLDSLESIYDINTKESLRLPEEVKKDIYHVLRWVLTEFPALRAKDNIDVSIKRRRQADEYAAHIYAMQLTKGIRRISDMGKKVKLKQIVSAVYTKPDHVISQIILMSNLVSYSNMVNDNDALQVLKFSYKGISGLGEGGGKIQPVYRFVDSSHMGIIDLDTSTASDPGMSGMLCPMTKMYGDGFTDFKEPCNWDNDFTKRVEDYNKKHHLQNPINELEKKEFDYEYIKDAMINKSLNMERGVCPIIDLTGEIDYTKPLSQQVMTGQNVDQPIEMKELFNISKDTPDPMKDVEVEYIYQPFMVEDNNNGHSIL